jgi:hypothetical protein
MPTRPKGEKRLAAAILRAAKVIRIATGEEPEEIRALAQKASKGGEGVRPRAAALAPQEPSEIAQAAAAAETPREIVLSLRYSPSY